MLETIVVNKYPVIRKILKNLSLLNGCEFSRVTGSGSACFGLFLTKKMADKGLKKIKKNFLNSGVLLVKLFKIAFMIYQKINWGVAKR